MSIKGIGAYRPSYAFSFAARHEGTGRHAPNRLQMHPTVGNGKICYIEIPALDVERSAGFYQRVFGWHLRKRGDGSTAFDDAVGEVSGTWVRGRPPTTEPGLLTYIMVDSVAATLDSIVENGGNIVQPIGADAPEITARFSDPAGNLLGLYQNPT
jgi:predicted enzyme related to lactoylglutathione lyase